MTKNTETREFVLRHAKSKANEQQVLISDPEIGTKTFGILDSGRPKVREYMTAAQQLEGLGQGRKVVYICSPFKRAIETAEEARSVIDGLIVIDDRLSERWMGDFDGKGDDLLKTDIWNNDALNDDNHVGNVESPREVALRMQAVFHDAREAFPGCDIVYVTHGDPGQISLTAEQGINTGRHRDLPHLENAEIRRFH